MRSLLNLYLAAHQFVESRDDERGATATEYAILVAMIALVIILGAAFFGNALSNWFNNLGTTVSTGF